VNISIKNIDKMSADFRKLTILMEGLEVMLLVKEKTK